MSITEEDIAAADEGGGRYSLRRFLTQSPAAFKGWLLLVATAYITIKHVEVSPESLAIGGLLVERTLEQFYVKPVLAKQQEVAVIKGIGLGQQTTTTNIINESTAPERPLRAH